MPHYLVRKKVINSTEYGVHTSNDIVAMEGKRVLQEIEDVSVNTAFAEEITAQLNASAVSIVHFQDVIEDWIAQA